MTAERKIEKRLKAMSAHIPSPALDIVRLDEGIEKHSKIIRTAKAITSAAAAIILIFGAVFVASAIADRRIASTVTLDTRAGITIGLNSNDKVVEISGYDQRGKRALSGFDTNADDIETVTGDLIRHLINNDTLSEYDNTVLVTAASDDAETEEALRSEFAQAVEAAYADNRFDGALLSQTDDESMEAKRIAGRYHISHGKAQLMRELINADSTMSYQSLSRLNINDLNLIADSIRLEYADITETGESSDLRYLNEIEALRIVTEHLGADDAATVRVRLDARDGELLYRLTVRVGDTVYIYNLVASSGEIITVIKSGPNRTEVLVNNQSSTATVDDNTSPYIPPSNTAVSGVSGTAAPVEAETSAPVTEAPTEAPTSAPSDSPATQPTESADVPDAISFTSAQYYRCDSNLLDAGYSIPPWDTQPADSTALSSIRVFLGSLYQSSSAGGQQFMGGTVAVICNTDQLKNFLADHSYAYIDTDGNTFDTSKYTDTYFKTRSLIISAYELQNYNYRFTISDMTVSGDTLYLNTAMDTATDLPSTTYTAHDLTAYEVDRSQLQSVTQLSLY